MVSPKCAETFARFYLLYYISDGVVHRARNPSKHVQAVAQETDGAIAENKPSATAGTDEDDDADDNLSDDEFLGRHHSYF